MNFVDVSFSPIVGVMLGAEYVEEDGDHCLVLDFLVMRILIVWGKE